MSYFCNKRGTECPHKSIHSQTYCCEDWDPCDVIANKRCRHALEVDNMELARKQWAASRRINSKKRIETPERPKTQPVIINKAGEIDAKQTAILQRLELEKRQTAALEKIAEMLENVNAAITDIADHFGLQIAMIIDTLEPIAKVFRDDDEAAANPCDNDCEHCDWATCPKEEEADERHS